MIGFGFAISSALSKEEGFIISTKRMGVVMAFIFFLISIFLIPSLVGNIVNSRNYLIKKCYDNNITLDKKYDEDIKKIKIENFKKGL
jgi:Na+-transporting methylmalonyl-CoA/oxaloacetate decarboxylase gamma subunit